MKLRNYYTAKWLSLHGPGTVMVLQNPDFRPIVGTLFKASASKSPNLQADAMYRVPTAVREHLHLQRLSWNTNHAASPNRHIIDSIIH